MVPGSRRACDVLDVFSTASRTGAFSSVSWELDGDVVGATDAPPAS